MTIADLKRHDKRLREVKDPLGTGFRSVRKIMEEWAEESGLPIHDIVEQYVAWKWRR